ncbi:hypothetical protein AX15_004482 [Amanita polypyramis BW_CC]|nr:hypothetical protein AX15_004482 [Amanita polypyramis BW_CC]
MSKLINVSHKLSRWMLDGWVLTDVPCATPGCHVPLLRSPQDIFPAIHFCPNCDDDPGSSSSSIDSKRSGSSTPPTEVSNLPESPQLVPAMDIGEISRRREQSDRASREIGNRLLRGWTMLADECPALTCYGVPLVRPPKPGAEKDARKECVICGTVYTAHVDQAGRQQLVPLGVSNHPATSSGGGVAPSFDPKIVPGGPSTTLTGRDVTTRPTGNSLLRPTDSVVSYLGSLLLYLLNDAVSLSPNKQDGAETLRALKESSESLQTTLRTLSMRLLSLSEQGTPVDPASISSTAEAMLKVTQALSQVKQLEWSERQARSL